MNDVAEYASVSRERVENAYGVMNRELGLAVAAQSPRGYVPRFAAAVGVDDEVRLAAEQFARQAEEADLHNGRNPAGVAAACLYEASKAADEGVSQLVIAECADVSAATIRARWRELQKLTG